MPVYYSEQAELSLGTFGENMDLLALGDGRFIALYNQSSGANDPMAVIGTVDAAGVITVDVGDLLQADTAGRDWRPTDGKIAQVAANLFLITGLYSGDIKGVVASTSGTTLTIESSVNKTGSYSDARMAWDLSGGNGLWFYPNGGFSNVIAASISGNTLSFGSDSQIDWGNYSAVLGISKQAISFDPVDGRYLIAWIASRSAVDGVWAMTVQVSGNSIVNPTTPVLIDTIAASPIDVQLEYHSPSGKHVLLHNHDAENRSTVISVSAGVVTAGDTTLIRSSGVEGSIFAHPVTNDVYFSSAETLLNTVFGSGRLVGNRVVWQTSDSFEDYNPASTVPTDPPYGFSFDALTGYTLLSYSRVDDAKVIPIKWNSGAVDVPLLQAAGADRVLNEGDILLPGLASDHSNIILGDLDTSLPALSVVDFSISTISLNELNADLPSLQGQMFSGASLDASIAPLSASMTATIDTVGVMSVALPALAGYMVMSQGIVARSSVRFGALVGTMYGGALLSATLPSLNASASATTGISMQFDVELPGLTANFSAETGRYGILSASFPALESRYGVMAAQFPALSGSMTAIEAAIVSQESWAMNMAHFGVTRYPSYPFEFLLRWKGNEYLAGPDGLYLLGSGDDDGDPIESEFAFPPSNFGSAQEKRCPRVYLSGKVDGELSVSMSADDGDTFSSSTTGYSGVDYWRAKIGRGIHGHNLKIGVANVNGADFEIDQIDALIHLTGRKV